MSSGQTRTGAIGRANLVKLLSQPGMPSDFRDMIAFGLCQGLRPQELYLLRKDWLTGLDGDRPMLRIEHHKTSDMSKVYIPRTVPLTAMAAEIARQQIGRHPDSEHVFLDGNGKPYRSAHSLRQRLQRWGRRTGIGHITTYDLRHTFGTAAAKDTNLEVVRQVMGHTKTTTTSRYISNNEDYHVEAMRRVGEQMAEMIAECTPTGDGGNVDVVVEASAVKVAGRDTGRPRPARRRRDRVATTGSTAAQGSRARR